MSKLIYAILLLLVITNTPESFAQTNNGDGFEEERNSRSILNFSFMNPPHENYPILELNYSMTKPIFTQNDFKESFKQSSAIDFSLGKIEFPKLRDSTSIVEEFKSNTIAFKYMLSSSSDNQSSNEIEIELKSLSLNNSKGYAYKLGENHRLILFQKTGMNWNYMSWNSPTSINFEDSCSLNTYSDRIRFGDVMGAGIKYQFMRNISLDLSYERDLIYQRHLFWYWSASQIINKIGSGAINILVNEVEKNSPNVAPIVYFILQNAYQYGMYELYKKDMNWPISTAPSMQYEHFKIGLSFIF